MMNKEEKSIVKQALSILDREIKNKPFCFTSPDSVKDFLRLNLETKEREFFAVIFVDTQHKVISYQEMFAGTLDSAAVYPREVVKAALFENASAVILAHNHPSGDSSPSNADKAITNKLKQSLDLVGVRVLDHFVIGKGEIFSFAENCLI